MKAILTFSGTLDFESKYTTIGDVMALYNVATKLYQKGVSFVVAWHEGFLNFDKYRVNIKEVIPGDFTHLIYVCGPVANTARKLCDMFPDSRRIAIGVSVLDHNSQDNIFHKMFVRDSKFVTNFDLALADIGYPHVSIDSRFRRSGLSMCTVGSQNEYRQSNQSLMFSRAFSHLLNSMNAKRKINVQTLIQPRNPLPLASEGDLQSSSIIISNRMHGCLLGIYHRVPVIAFDQISGGAKVTRLVSKLGWPVFNFDQFDLKKFKLHLEECNKGWNSGWMERSRTLMIQLSRNSLEEAIDMIIDDAISVSDF